jgi:protein-S-isoprenylcysteine O-methyltransferase Ste14
MLLLFKNLLFTLLAPGTIAVLIPWFIRRGRLPVSGLPMALAVTLFAVGAGIYVWCVWDFASFGRGTPAPIDAPKQLVVRGLYRYVRNPMYVGVLTVILGWVAVYRSAALVLYAIVVATVFHLFIVLYEERHLQRVFGTEYSEYRTRVGRWLPRFRNSPAALQDDPQTIRFT